MLFFIVLVSMIASCGKKHTVHIKAVNPVTGQVYVGLKYRISQEKTTLWDEKTKIIASGELNENGEANATFRRGNNPIRVQVERPSNCCYSKNDVYYIKGDDPNHEVLVEFAECAYLKLNINNVNCQGASDYLKLYYMGRQVGGQSSGIVGALSKEGGGCYSFIASSFSSVPMGEMYWKWEVTRNSITNIYYDTIYLSPEEYRVYDINY
jgi:hypothetical protein